MDLIDRRTMLLKQMNYVSNKIFNGINVEAYKELLYIIQEQLIYVNDLIEKKGE